jgi:hypothetical protein
MKSNSASKYLIVCGTMAVLATSACKSSKSPDPTLDTSLPQLSLKDFSGVSGFEIEKKLSEPEYTETIQKQNAEKCGGKHDGKAPPKIIVKEGSRSLSSYEYRSDLGQLRVVTEGQILDVTADTARLLTKYIESPIRATFYSGDMYTKDAFNSTCKAKDQSQSKDFHYFYWNCDSETQKLSPNMQAALDTYNRSHPDEASKSCSFEDLSEKEKSEKQSEYYSGKFTLENGQTVPALYIKTKSISASKCKYDGSDKPEFIEKSVELSATVYADGILDAKNALNACAFLVGGVASETQSQDLKTGKVTFTSSRILRPLELQ